jgi:hypothetical protein
MQILFGLFIFMVSSSLLMVGYVWVRDIRHKKARPGEIIASDDKFFEEIQQPETALSEYDYRQKTA